MFEVQSNEEGAARRDVAQPAPVAKAADTIEQVRELLFGQQVRRTEQTFTDVRGELKASIDELRAEMRQHVDMLSNRLMDLERTTENRRLETITEIGQAISDLGARIQGMGADAARR